MATELKSANNTLDSPCVVFALRRESMYFRRACPIQQRFPGAPCRAHFCGSEKRDERDEKDEKRCREPALMVETGVGAAAVATALRWCLNAPHFDRMRYRPRFVVSVGFSGALRPEQRVGDLVVATEVIDNEGNRWPTFYPDALANRNIAAGRLLTMPGLVGDPKEKQRLGKEYDAIAVDMESVVAARLCFQHQVPFACLRVISDDWDTPLSPQLLDLLKQGRVALPRLGAGLLRHPLMIVELWRLARQTRLAACRLVQPLTDVIFGA